MSKREIGCRYTDEIVCPYCGYELGGSWNFDLDEQASDMECEECSEIFRCYRDLAVKYVSGKKVKR